MIRVAVIAPLAALRIGLREVLRSLPDVQVVAESPRLEAFENADIRLVAGLEPFSPPQPASTPILLLTDDPESASALFDLPLWGLLPLDAAPEELSAALQALSQGLWVAPPALARSLLTRRPAPLADFPSEPLTARETEVLQRMTQGLANKQIAASLGISEHTVKFHLSSLYAKLGVASRTEAVRAGVQRGLVTL